MLAGDLVHQVRRSFTTPVSGSPRSITRALGASSGEHREGFRSALGLWSRNLNVGSDVRVAAFLVTRIHSRRGVAVGGAVYYCGVRVQRTRIQHGVDYGERSARVGVYRAINVIAGYVRRRARAPRQIHRVCRRRRTSPRQCFRRSGRLSIAAEGECGARRSGCLRTESHCKRSTLARRDGHW